MMNKIHAYLKLIVLGPLLTTIFSFLMGMIFVIYNFGKFNWGHSLLFLITALLVHMMTNVSDNLFDYQKAIKYQANRFIKGTRVKGLSIKRAVRLDIILAILIAILGLTLVSITTWWLLIIGIWGVLVAFFYSAGKHSLSSTPFGDLASGVTMGIGITFACVMVNVDPSQFNLMLFLKAILASGLTIFSITNMVLANNICDLQDDLHLHRQTIVSKIGKSNALKLYDTYYVIMFLSIIIAVILHVLPLMMLIVLISIPKVLSNAKKFAVKQVKTETFGLTVQNINWFCGLTAVVLIWMLIVNL